jgi:hypothetical protein
MPRHRPRIPTARIRPNPAAAALGVGIQPDRWTPEGIINAMTNRYLQLIKLAEDGKEKGDTRKQRLYTAGAFEHATLIASYYQDKGDTEVFARWDGRARRASAVAYRLANETARVMGTETPPEPATEDET